MEIANELIPYVLKADNDESGNVQNKPQCFAHILRFYDGICCWEQGSATPIMHIGWAKPMVSTCSKFEAKIRRQVEFRTQLTHQGIDHEPELVLNNNYYKKYCSGSSSSSSSSSSSNQDQDCDNEEHEKSSPAVAQHVSAKDIVDSNADNEVIALLSEYCHSKVLNIDYLLGQSSQPFSKSTPRKQQRVSYLKQHQHCPLSDGSSGAKDDETAVVTMRLKSAKMVGLKDLLSKAEKLNTNAIQLQLTALSQVVSKSSSGIDAAELTSGSSRPKRARREWKGSGSSFLPLLFGFFSFCISHGLFF